MCFRKGRNEEHERLIKMPELTLSTVCFFHVVNENGGLKFFMILLYLFQKDSDREKQKGGWEERERETDCLTVGSFPKWPQQQG